MKILKYITIIFVLVIFTVIQSCDTDELHDLDIPKISIDDTKLNPAELFANAQLEMDVSAAEVTQTYLHAYLQYYGSSSIVMPGDDYQYEIGQNDDLWRSYENEIKLLVHVIETLKDDPEQINNVSMCRILKVLAFSRLTDLYGDIPYFESGLGFFEGIFHPKYDTQQSIYTDMLNELDEATGNFNTSKTIWTDEDFINGGDIDMWKKFGYSLMMRLAMRISNVDASMAQQFVHKALTGGVVANNDENILLEHSDGPKAKNQNQFSLMVLDRDSEKYNKLGKTLIDWLINTNDPRIRVFSGGVYRADLEVPSGGAMNERDIYFDDELWDWSTDSLVGHPHAVNPITLRDQTGVGDQRAIQQAFPRAHPSLVKYDAPTILMTCSEMKLLTAEAAIKGWVTDDAETLYNDGVKIGMKQWAIIFADESLDITDTEIDTYLAAHPYNASEGEKMIGEQYWLTKFHCGHEGYANFRRTGYPELQSQVSGIEIPRRLQYPVDAVTMNQENVNEAISRQGPDEIFTKVWWDK